MLNFAATCTCMRTCTLLCIYSISVCIIASYTMCVHFFSLSPYMCSFYLTVNRDGSVAAEQPDGAVSEATLLKILDWKRTGASMDEIIDMLRMQTVPAGYTIHPWNPGIAVCVYLYAHVLVQWCVNALYAFNTQGRPKETRADKLRSIIAQMAFTYKIDQWEKEEYHFANTFMSQKSIPLLRHSFMSVRMKAMSSRFVCNSIVYVHVNYCLLVLISAYWKPHKNGGSRKTSGAKVL